jgi:hypothetical protein
MLKYLHQDPKQFINEALFDYYSHLNVVDCLDEGLFAYYYLQTADAFELFEKFVNLNLHFFLN